MSVIKLVLNILLYAMVLYDASSAPLRYRASLYNHKSLKGRRAALQNTEQTIENNNYWSTPYTFDENDHNNNNNNTTGDTFTQSMSSYKNSNDSHGEDTFYKKLSVTDSVKNVTNQTFENSSTETVLDDTSSKQWQNIWQVNTDYNGSKFFKVKPMLAHLEVGKSTTRIAINSNPIIGYKPDPYRKFAKECLSTGYLKPNDWVAIKQRSAVIAAPRKYLQQLRTQLYARRKPNDCHTPDQTDARDFLECQILRHMRLEVGIPHYPAVPK